MNLRCRQCSLEILSYWNFCPECGTTVSTKESKSSDPKIEDDELKITERFLLLANDYRFLTGHLLEGDVLKAFVKHPSSGTLSVIDASRRLQAGKKCRKSLGGGKYSLDLALWLETVYEVHGTDSASRVWVTEGGSKYHALRDCKGMKDGQEYARSKGKDTYNPQFIPIRRAAFVLDLKPCLVCKPAKYKGS